jgi:hypothetical protein
MLFTMHIFVTIKTEIPVSSCFIRCTHMLRFLRRSLLLHVTVCKTSRLVFSIAVERFYLCSIQRVLCPPPSIHRLWGHVRLYSSQLCWCARTHLNSADVSRCLPHGYTARTFKSVAQLWCLRGHFPCGLCYDQFRDKYPM